MGLAKLDLVLRTKKKKVGNLGIGNLDLANLDSVLGTKIENVGNLCINSLHSANSDSTIWECYLYTRHILKFLHISYKIFLNLN